jgi:predicted dehydrogenase
MGKIKVGVVGMGHLGKYHLQKYLLMEEVDIAGVADVQKERAEKAAQTCPCPAFTDHRELLDRVDAVSIAVPTKSHYSIARDFLLAGKDVLLEKPMTDTLPEADELIRMAEEKGRILQIGFVERFNPAIVAVSNVIGEPMFIESHRLHPFIERGTDVDVILDLMIHDLDIILHFVRYPVKDVEAVGISILSDKVDIANARITFENGCVANMTASRVTFKNMQKIRFFGLSGYHSVDYSDRGLVSLSRKVTGDGKINIGFNNVEIGKWDPLEEEIRAFIRSVKTREKPMVSGREGRQSLELALRINEKMKTARDMLK